MAFTVIIPARYASTRFPGKVLYPIQGKPMVQHVYERAVASGADQVVIATDDERVKIACEAFNAPVCMTAEEHRSGTERIAEAVEALELDAETIVVNVQADEPLIPPSIIRQLGEHLDEYEHAKMATVCEPLTSVKDLFNPNVVKVVMSQRGYALYFSRAPIPWEQPVFNQSQEAIELKGQHWRHCGLYAYRADFLKTYIEWERCPLSEAEDLEQLRVLWHGGRIHLAIAQEKLPPEINTLEDLKKLEECFS
ncbi:MAG TPA: 3-deoxy-manno-octulosonate cytidylyltransferase [Coxiellaceae bacterium]|nr:3-deoxy-manno-octulosonate cytidylyltransferase [Coxiellaceae bacterium]